MFFDVFILESLDLGVILSIEADIVAVFASLIILGDHPYAAFKSAVGSVEMLSLWKLADDLL